MKLRYVLAFLWAIIFSLPNFASTNPNRRPSSLAPALLALTDANRILLLGEVHEQQYPRLLFIELLEQIESYESVGTILFEAFYSDTQVNEISAFDAYLADRREVLPDSPLEKGYLRRMGVSKDGKKKGLFGLNFFTQMRALRKLKQSRPSINICNTNVSYLNDADQAARMTDLIERWKKLSDSTRRKLLTFSNLSEQSLERIDDDLFREAEMFERFKKCIAGEKNKVLGLYGWGHAFKNFKMDFSRGFTMRDFEPSADASAEVIGVFILTTFEKQEIESDTFNTEVRRFSDQISPKKYSLLRLSTQMLPSELIPLRDLVEFAIVGPPTIEDPLFFDFPY